MIGQLLDAAGQNGDLHFGRTGIRIMTMIIRYQFGLDFFRERHDVCFPFFRLCRSPCLQPKPHTLLRENREAGPVTWKNYTRKWVTRLRPGSRCRTRSASIPAGKLLPPKRERSRRRPGVPPKSAM